MIPLVRLIFWAALLRYARGNPEACRDDPVFVDAASGATCASLQLWRDAGTSLPQLKQACKPGTVAVACPVACDLCHWFTHSIGNRKRKTHCQEDASVKSCLAEGGCAKNCENYKIKTKCPGNQRKVFDGKQCRKFQPGLLCSYNDGAVQYACENKKWKDLATPSPTVSAPPSSPPTPEPTWDPTILPSGMPSEIPSSFPSEIPTPQSSLDPSGLLTTKPSMEPSEIPTVPPSESPSSNPSGVPTAKPSTSPSEPPTMQPSESPSSSPSDSPTTAHSERPSQVPTAIDLVPLTHYPCKPGSGRTCGNCEGDCNLDTDCGEGLRCFVRDSGTDSMGAALPGCRMEDDVYIARDYCVRASLYACEDVTEPFEDPQAVYGSPRTCAYETTSEWIYLCQNHGLKCRESCQYCREDSRVPTPFRNLQAPVSEPSSDSGDPWVPSIAG